MTTEEQLRSDPRARADRVRLREWIRATGLTQRKAAFMLGTSQPHLSEFLAGNRELSFLQAVRAWRVSGIPLEIFGAGREEAA